MYNTMPVVTQEAQALSDGALMTDAAAGYELVRHMATVRALTFQQGWSLFYAGGSPGLIRSMAALWGWKAARATVTASDVDYR